jgi:tight adherence protein B
METVMRDATPPISDEFRRAIQEMSLGATVEEALRGMSERIGSKDIELMITAILIQLQVGGNLAELLDGIAATIQERVRIRGQIRIVTAQGRLTGVIVGLLPFALAFIMSIFKPDYLKVLIINPVGRMMLLVGLLAQLVGVFLVRKIVNMEV